jgi:NAD(P)-dependent dehydrogenase (short-subunit alcohol dehydrogenase family)
VHAAAVQILGAAGKVAVADWARSLQVNLLAVDEIVGACEDTLRAGRGSVVAIGSVHAFATTREMVAYATSKAALTGWVRAAALDLAPQVRVNGLAPGAVRTPMLESGFARRPDEGGIEGSLRALAAKTPLQAVAAPEAVAAMVATLCDDEVSGYVTGSIVVMDGGALLRLGTE